MILGDPEKFAFIIERIPEWENDSYKNGIMFVIINDEIYPKTARTTTFNSELPDILSLDSAFMAPVVDVELYEKSDKEIIACVSDEDNTNYYRYFIPFHEINDSGYRIYIISNGSKVKIIVCKIEIETLEVVDKLVLPLGEYDRIKSQVFDFWNSSDI